MASEPNSMDEVAVLMRESLPSGMSPAEFGQQMAWGRGSDEALRRIDTLTVEELHEIGLNAEQAIQWAIAYDAVSRLMPQNPSAVGRVALLRHAADLLSGA